MITHSLQDLVGEKKFVSKNYGLLLRYARKGGLSGDFVNYANGLSFQKALSGLYLLEDDRIKITFTVEFRDPNLDSGFLTCFTGEIIKYEQDSTCMILKWLQLQESAPLKSTILDSGVDVLLEDSEKDPAQEIQKILSFDLSKMIRF